MFFSLIYIIYTKNNKNYSNVILIVGFFLYLLCLQNSLFQTISSLIIPLDLFIVTLHIVGKIGKDSNNYSKEDITSFISNYINFNKKKTSIIDDKKKQIHYEKNYIPENVGIQHTIKHTINNITK